MLYLLFLFDNFYKTKFLIYRMASLVFRNVHKIFPRAQRAAGVAYRGAGKISGGDVGLFKLTSYHQLSTQVYNKKIIFFASKQIIYFLCWMFVKNKFFRQLLLKMGLPRILLSPTARWWVDCCTSWRKTSSAMAVSYPPTSTD